MSKLQEMRDARGKAIADARTILDKADAEKRSLSAEESINYDTAFAKAEELRASITREESLATAERDAAEVALRSKDALKDTKLGKSVDDETRALGKTGTDEYRDAFNKMLLETRAGLSDAERRALQADSDVAGGFTVAPMQFVKQLLKDVDNQVFMRQRATKFPVTSAASLGVPTLASDVSDSDWTTELATGNEDSSMLFGFRELQPHPMAKRLKVSNTLLRTSSISIDALVRARLAYKAAVTQEKAFMTGTGVNQALGIFTASANGITTARDVSTGNTTTALTFDGLIEAKYSLKGQYWNNADWIFHRDALKMLAKLKDGEGQYIWRESVRDGEADRLLGRPIIMSEYAPNTFTTGLYVGMLGDYSNYWIADALNLQIQVVKELYAETDQTGYIMRLSCDGMPVLNESFARVKLA